jgi:ABC-2 type transport system permease protein
MKNILFFLLEKEFKQIMRDRFMPKIIFAVPVLQLLILPFAADFEMHNINLGIIDNDRSVQSTRLVDKILASGYFRPSAFSTRFEEGISSVESNISDILIEIPAGFERRLSRGEASPVSIAANAVNGSKGGLSSSYLTAIIRDFNAAEGHPPSGVTYTYLFNPHLNYKTYMVPGIIVFLLTLIGGFFSALNIVSEKEKGTIEQINVAPVPKSLFLLSKLIPFWIIGFVLLTISALIACLVYGLTPVGSFAVTYLFAAIYLVAFTGFGLAISSISSNRQQAMFTTFFFMIIFALMSGLFTPINSMPEWAQRITLFNPIRYFVEVMRMVYLKGSGLQDLSTHFIAITIFATLFNALALSGYHKRG